MKCSLRKRHPTWRKAKNGSSRRKTDRTTRTRRFALEFSRTALSFSPSDSGGGPNPQSSSKMLACRHKQSSALVHMLLRADRHLVSHAVSSLSCRQHLRRQPASPPSRKTENITREVRSRLAAVQFSGCVAWSESTMRHTSRLITSHRFPTHAPSQPTQGGLAD
jgi:hypothetical protein